MIEFAPFCFVTVTDQKALDVIHESGSHGGSFRDRHPWRMAAEMLEQANRYGKTVALMFVVEPALCLSSWAIIQSIEVATYSGQKYETTCSFEKLGPVNPIFESLDSLTLMPSKEQLHRESIEPIRTYRQHLDATQLYPYAICETPPFVNVEPTSSLENP